MSSNQRPAEPSPVSWREQAVARSLDAARVRAEARVQRFLDAARELMQESEVGKDFTIQEVVERSGQSLRSFYMYFGSKQDLLLAVFEDLVRSSADRLRAEIEDEDDTLERLHKIVVAYYRMCRVPGKRRGTRNRAAPAMAEFAQKLLTAHPAEAAAAFVPLVDLFDEVLGQAIDAGTVRPDLDRRRLVGVILESIMFTTFSATIGGATTKATNDAGEELWDIFFRGVGPR